MLILCISAEIWNASHQIPSGFVLSPVSFSISLRLREMRFVLHWYAFCLLGLCLGTENQHTERLVRCLCGLQSRCLSVLFTHAYTHMHTHSHRGTPQLEQNSYWHFWSCIWEPYIYFIFRDLFHWFHLMWKDFNSKYNPLVFRKTVLIKCKASKTELSYFSSTPDHCYLCPWGNVVTHVHMLVGWSISRITQELSFRCGSR